jgi:polysaccharide export outer membrane protein
MMNKDWARIIALAVLSAAVSAAALGQTPAPATTPAASTAAQPASTIPEYLIATGDVLRITVFQNPDLTLETRVAENGRISYPLIGSVPVSGSSVGAAERRIAQMLTDGGFIVSPQVTIVVLQVRGNQVTVLGQVAKPGRFPLDTPNIRLTEVLALAGGIAPTGADVVVLTGMRNGKKIHQEIDVQSLAAAGDPAADIHLQDGDLLFVNRAPTFYIYGEVQKPGAFRLERGMTVMQALATGGGLTPKGTQRGLTIHRHGAGGAIEVIVPKLDDPILNEDVLYIRESIF